MKVNTNSTLLKITNVLVIWIILISLIGIIKLSLTKMDACSVDLMMFILVLGMATFYRIKLSEKFIFRLGLIPISLGTFTLYLILFSEEGSIPLALEEVSEMTQNTTLILLIVCVFYLSLFFRYLNEKLSENQVDS